MAFSLKAFKDKYEGRRVSGYSASGGQCVDLCRQYMKERWGNPYLVPRGNAETWFANASTSRWTKVRYLRGRRPPQGAIVCFRVGEFGHVAIAVGGSTVDVLQSFDQNWSRRRICTREAHRYTSHGVVGWLIKR